MMAVRADAHIHLFDGGYQNKSFASRPGVSDDEAAYYDSLSREHDVVAALVVGYAVDRFGPCPAIVVRPALKEILSALRAKNGQDSSIRQSR